MKPISIKLPPGAEEANYLYAALEIADLTQDMLTVRLPNGYFIDVGWYPEHDANGRFVIRVFRDSWENQKLFRPVTTRELSEVVFNVERLAEHFSRQQIPMMCSGEIRTSKVLV